MVTKTRKRLEEYLNLNYPFRVDADPEGGYVITFSDLPGCMTQIEDASEIGRAAEEVRRLWMTTEYEDGAEIPLPSYPEEYSGKFNLRLSKSLHRRLAEAAEREAVSLNHLVVSLLAEGEAFSRANAEVPRERASALRSLATKRDRSPLVLSERVFRRFLIEAAAREDVDLNAAAIPAAIRHMRDAFARPETASLSNVPGRLEALARLEVLHHRHDEGEGADEFPE